LQNTTLLPNRKEGELKEKDEKKGGLKGEKRKKKGKEKSETTKLNYFKDRNMIPSQQNNLS
jgi:hypothetical protein